MGLTFATKKKRRFFRWRTLIVLLVIVAVAAGAYVVLRPSDSQPSLPSAELDSFLRAWNKGDTAGMAALVDAPPPDLATSATSLAKAAPGNTVVYTRTGLTRLKGDTSGTYHAHATIAGFGAMDWNGTLHFVRAKVNNKQVWRVTWQPDLLYPGLAAGERLTEKITWPDRSSIFAADGTLLSGAQSVVTIGLEPDRVGAALPQVKALLKSLAGTDPAAVDAALHAPGVQPNFFVPVATVPDDARYASTIRPQLAPIPGVFFRRAQGVLSPIAGIGTQLLGNVGDITAERLSQLGAPYRVGDQVGLSGLQAAFETRLAGKPSADVIVTRGSGTLRVVKHFPGRAGAPVRLTIDPHTQSAAEAALAGVPQPAALVAIDAATGQLKAIVSKPDGGFDRAIDGTYPPGSTFKIITSDALLSNGSSGSTPAPCPATITVDGRTFRNFEGEANGAIDLAHAFQISCNNAFIGLGDQLPVTALTKAAAAFGFNSKWSLPVPSYGGTFPTPKDRAELAASAIGQGRILASPAQMASVAAAVAAGQWHAPVLTTQPAPTVPTVAPLDPAVLATLRAFMASVPAPGGTAAGAGLPAGTFGKTGTAEFGSGNPPQTHAWFVGYRNGIAFAVVVEGGGVGGRVAAPLAAKFLNALG